MAEVILEEVTKDFGEVVAVNKANIHIRDTEFLVLVGPSGCGKTTTLRLIAGLEEITEGKIFIGERLVNDVPPKDRNIAMVFQNYALYPHMDVYNNMAFGLKLRKMPRADIDRRVKRTSELLGIQELLDRRPKQLSGGQRQRVALGRAIVREPAVFLMDEPLSNLDAKLRVQMRAELQKLHDRLQTTAIYVTHDQTEAMTMGDRLVVMDEGIIQQVAKPLTLYNEPVNMFVAGFIGAPAMNFKNCILDENNGDYTLIDTNGNFTLGLDDERVTDVMDDYVGEEVTFGIRPEDIYDTTISTEIDFDEFNTIETEVDVVEPMGSETFVYINIGEDDLGNVEDMTARVGAGTSANVGEKLKVAYDMSMAHIFDSETEENLILK